MNTEENEIPNISIRQGRNSKIIYAVDSAKDYDLMPFQ